MIDQPNISPIHRKPKTCRITSVSARRGPGRRAKMVMPWRSTFGGELDRYSKVIMTSFYLQICLATQISSVCNSLFGLSGHVALISEPGGPTPTGGVTVPCRSSPRWIHITERRRTRASDNHNRSVLCYSSCMRWRTITSAENWRISFPPS